MTPSGWWRYVPVARKRAQGRRALAAMRDGDDEPQPVRPMGRIIARSFWGKAWCDHLESFSDYENRLPRGRTYVRRGAVLHLDIGPGCIDAWVAGTELYEVEIRVDTLPAPVWKAVKDRCRGEIGSILELLEGRLSDRVMARVCDRDNGLFPKPEEIGLGCSCPDWAVMCKHVAAVLYGVGNRLDAQPELLFELRGVDAAELIAAQVSMPTGSPIVEGALAEAGLGELFGIEIEDTPDSGIEPEGRRAASPTFDPAAPTGAAIRHLREEDGLSVAEFAWALGVSEASVRRWEGTRGRLTLQARALEALSDWANG